MLRTFAACILALAPAFAMAENPPWVPADYKLLYSQDFSSPDAIKDFVFTDSKAWNAGEGEGKASLELARQSNYKPPVRSPVNIALIADHVFGDFILEADCLQTGREYGHRDMCIYYGFQSPTRFYYTHIATKADDHAHNCFIVNDAPRVKFASETTAGADWGLNVWRKVRLERKASDGTVKVWFEDMDKPIMTANDKTHGPGWVGFGSFDDTGRIANIRIWGPSSEQKRAPEFAKP
jgi:hypothetical protein